MKTASIFTTKNFDTAHEYVAAHRNTDISLDWDSVNERGWTRLADILEIDVVALAGAANKARRAIDKAASMIIPVEVKPISTKIETEVKTSTITEKRDSILSEIADKEAQQEKTRQILLEKALKNQKAQIPVETVEVVSEVKKEAVPAISKEQHAKNVTKVLTDSEKSDAEKLVELLANLTGGKKSVDPNEVISIINTEFARISEQVTEQINDMVDSVSENVKAMIEGNSRNITVTRPDETVVNVGLAHKCFDDILLSAQARVHLYLVGQAGAGKTHVCEQVSEALNLPFYSISVCAQSSKTDLLGYQSITDGHYITTSFRQAYEFGGIFVMDEIDNGNANVISVLNSALANGKCAFPDGMIKKHEDFVLIACANTYGQGADRQYVGRNQLDAATLDRFAILDFDYDEELELAIAPNQTFCLTVQKIRKALKGERVVISPRATIKGGKLINAGMAYSKVIDMVIKNGMTPEHKLRVDAAMA